MKTGVRSAHDFLQLSTPPQKSSKVTCISTARWGGNGAFLMVICDESGGMGMRRICDEKEWG